MKKFLCSIFAVILMLSFVACGGGDKSEIKPFKIKGKNMTSAEAVMWQNNIDNLAQKAKAEGENQPAIWYSVDYKANINKIEKNITDSMTSTVRDIYSSTDIQLSGDLLAAELLSDDSSFDIDIKVQYTDKWHVTQKPDQSGEQTENSVKVITHTADIVVGIVAPKADEVYVDYNIVMKEDDKETSKTEKVQGIIHDLEYFSDLGEWDEWQEEILKYISNMLFMNAGNIEAFVTQIPFSMIIDEGGKICKNGRGIAVEAIAAEKNNYNNQSMVALMKCDFNKNQYLPKYLDFYINLNISDDQSQENKNSEQQLLNIKQRKAPSLKKPDGEYKQIR